MKTYLFAAFSIGNEILTFDIPGETLEKALYLYSKGAPSLQKIINSDRIFSLAFELTLKDPFQGPKHYKKSELLDIAESPPSNLSKHNKIYFMTLFPNNDFNEIKLAFFDGKSVLDAIERQIELGSPFFIDFKENKISARDALMTMLESKIKFSLSEMELRPGSPFPRLITQAQLKKSLNRTENGDNEYSFSESFKKILNNII